MAQITLASYSDVVELKKDIDALSSSTFGGYKLSVDTDLDTVTTRGFYSLTYSGSYPNSPVSSGRRFLLVYNHTSKYMLQMFILAEKSEVYTRTYHDGAFDNWIMKQEFICKGIDTETDLNTINTAGCYSLRQSGNYPNSPVASGHRFLIAMPAITSNYVQQIFIENGSHDIRTRMCWDGTWYDWSEDTNGIFKYQLGDFDGRLSGSHGGFFNREEKDSSGNKKDTLYQNSPKAYKSARDAGVKYQDVDIQFTSDLIPICMHDSSRTNMNGTEIKFSDHTLEEIKTMEFGDADYTWTLQTLAEGVAYLYDLGCKPMIDIHGRNQSAIAQLPTYLKKNHIVPVYLCSSQITDLTILVNTTNGSDLPLGYVIYDTDDVETKVNSWVSFVQTYSVKKSWLLFDYSIDISEYLEVMANNGIGTVGYVLGAKRASDVIPCYWDILLSETVNINYQRYLTVNS